MDKTIIPGEVAGEVDPPSSKSYAQRAIAAALLAHGGGNDRSESAGMSLKAGRQEVSQRGVSVLSGVEMCDDTAAALRVVQALGARVENPAPGTYEISGRAQEFPLHIKEPDGVVNKILDIGGRLADGDLAGALSKNIHDEVMSGNFTLDIGESGLSTRLFTPIAALCASPVTITGHGTILKRPMDMMLDPLRALGVEVRDRKGHLPVTVRGPMRGGEVEIDGSVSSQFLTGLLIALPLAASDTTVRVRGLRSIPYIDMTIDVMDRFGVDVDHRDYEEFYIPGAQRYTPASMRIEGDWSAASCLLVAGAVAGGSGHSGTDHSRTGSAGGSGHGGVGVTVKNLNPVSLQADVAIIEALSRAGAHIEQTADSVTVSRRELRAFEFDATDCPDLFPALAALAASCEGTSVILGTSRLTHKESDRAQAIRSEYRRLGIDVDISEENVMRITGSEVHGGVTVDSHGDHRMAMSLAVAALRADGPVTITGAECVSKSYSDFWEDFDRLRIKN